MCQMGKLGGETCRLEDRLEELWVQRLLRRKEALDAVALLGRVEARGAALGDNRQLRSVRKGFDVGLSDEDERTDDAQVAGVDAVVRLHRAQRAVVQRRHQEGLGAVVEVLRHRKYSVPLRPCDRVQEPSLHPGRGGGGQRGGE